MLPTLTFLPFIWIIAHMKYSAIINDFISFKKFYSSQIKTSTTSDDDLMMNLSNLSQFETFHLKSLLARNYKGSWYDSQSNSRGEAELEFTGFNYNYSDTASRTHYYLVLFNTTNEHYWIISNMFDIHSKDYQRAIFTKSHASGRYSYSLTWQSIVNKYSRYNDVVYLNESKYIISNISITLTDYKELNDSVLDEDTAIKLNAVITFDNEKIEMNLRHSHNNLFFKLAEISTCLCIWSIISMIVNGTILDQMLLNKIDLESFSKLMLMTNTLFDLSLGSMCLNVVVLYKSLMYEFLIISFIFFLNVFIVELKILWLIGVNKKENKRNKRKNKLFNLFSVDKLKMMGWRGWYYVIIWVFVLNISKIVFHPFYPFFIVIGSFFPQLFVSKWFSNKLPALLLGWSYWFFQGFYHVWIFIKMKSKDNILHFPVNPQFNNQIIIISLVLFWVLFIKTIGNYIITIVIFSPISVVNETEKRWLRVYMFKAYLIRKSNDYWYEYYNIPILDLYKERIICSICLKRVKNNMSRFKVEDVESFSIKMGKLFKVKDDMFLVFRKKNVDKILRTPCKHIFHSDCWIEWMKIKNQCPHCRNYLPPI